MRASIHDFYDGMKKHFGIGHGDVSPYVDRLHAGMSKTMKLDIIKFDEKFLHEKFGQYEDERGLSMKQLIKAEYGAEAVEFVARFI